MNSNPGARPLSLAVHLRSLSRLLRTNAISYNWDEHERCNCGLLACAITGKTALELGVEISATMPDGSEWSDLATNYCPITGVPVNKIFKQLTEAGLEFSDFGQLEHLSNPDILKRIDSSGYFITETKKRFLRGDVKSSRKWGKDDVVFHDQYSVAIYMNEWANLIEEYHQVRMEAIELRPLVESK